MRALILAASLIATVPIAVSADARPPRHGVHKHHPVCRVDVRHGHRVRTCR